MSHINVRSQLKQYAQVGAQSGVAAADPHRLVQMLMAGGLDKIASAKGQMERGEIVEKGANISWAISIVDSLQASLDRERGGDIAASLAGLYEYMTRRLLQANIENNTAILDEVAGLLSQIKEAWDAIPEEAKQPRPAGRAAV